VKPPKDGVPKMATNPLATQLIRIGSSHPDLRPHITPVLAALEKSSNKTTILLNTAAQEVSELVDAQEKVLKRWRDIAPFSSLKANHALASHLQKAEKELEEARKVVKKAEDEMKKLQAAAKR